jgi:hypothetical protein
MQLVGERLRILRRTWGNVTGETNCFDSKEAGGFLALPPKGLRDLLDVIVGVALFHVALGDALNAPAWTFHVVIHEERVPAVDRDRLTDAKLHLQPLAFLLKASCFALSWIRGSFHRARKLPIGANH